jgi:peptidoglycan pentaglycine glycine transferase (the first glycine)
VFQDLPGQHFGKQVVVTNLSVRVIKDAAEWEGVLLSLPNPHILQSWQWGALKAQTGWRAERLLWQAGAGPVAAGSLLVRRPAGIPGAPAVAYVPKGPILDWCDLRRAETVLTGIEQATRRSGAFFVKIDPDVRPDTPAGEAVLALLARRGWRPSAEQIQFKNTVVSDLRPDEDALLAGMKPKWRYNIRLAERRGVVVRAGTAADLPTFYAMYAETGARDGFLVRPYPYYQTIWESFLQHELAHLLVAEVAGAAVAGLILFRFGPTAWYFYGASTSQARPLMPNHALQWAALRWAKAAGCTTYNWWGAPDVLDESEPMWGVYHFKEGFGGEFVPGIGAYDYVTHPALYWLYTVAMPRVLDVARRRHRAAVPGAQDTGSHEA